VSAASEWVLDAPPPAPTARLAYGPDPNQFAELRVPEGPGPHPLAVALHGGFWKARYDLLHLGHACEALRQEGIATLSVEYRRVGQPGGGYPGTLEDLARALSLVPGLGAHGVRVDRTVVFGHSAGGQLALWLAATQRQQFGAQSIVAGALSLAGVTDLARGSALGLGDGAVDAFLGGAPEVAPEAYARASPWALLPLGVPQVLIHGEEDDTVPLGLSADYAAGARAQGDEVRFEPLPGVGHFEPIDPRSTAWPRVVAALRGFFGP
jgi:acetyl esterase/lipase